MGASVRRRSAALAAGSALLASTIWALPQTAFADEGTASIVGTVVGDEVSYGAGQVLAYRYESGSVTGEYSASISTDGSYALTDIPAGQYRIGFAQYSLIEDGFSAWTEWWDDSSTRAAGDLVTVQPGSSTSLDANVELLGGDLSYPVVKGTPVVGKPITVDPGVWPAGTDLVYEWAADGEAIRVTDEPSFVLPQGVAGAHISVTVYGDIDRFGAPSDTDYQYKTSWETESPVLDVLATATPSISGTPIVGAKLAAKPGTWTKGTSLSYQWLAGGTAIKGATASTYTVTSGQAGKALSVKVTGKLSGYESASKTSKATAKVALAPVPTVSGAVTVGGKVTAKPGTWVKGTALSYQWYAAGAVIKGATKSTLTLPSSAAGKAITVKVTGKNSGYPTVSKTSKATAKVMKSATPTVSGTVQVGKKLSAKAGSWTTGTRLTYQWYANGTAISKATTSTLTVPANAKGKKITVKVTGKKSGYATITRTSKATAAVKSGAVVSQVAKPASKTSCPKSHPIKGNQGADDWIYHVPGSTYYSRTNPEQCFSTTAAAQRAGYRAPKR